MEKITGILGEIGYDEPGLLTDGAGQMLVAFYVGGGEIEAGELRRRLASTLPAAMIPADFIRIDRVPLDSGGKTDRNALRRLAAERREADRRHVEPVSPTEKALARIWARALGVERVGAHDDFFRLGGDSIMVIQIVARARERGLHFTATELFSNPTVTALAERARTSPSPPIEQVPATGAVPLTPVQRWYLEQQPDGPNHWNQAVMLELPPEIDAAVLDAALRELISHHDALRLRLTHDDGQWRQIVASSVPELEVARVDLGHLDQELQADAMEDVAARLHQELDPTGDCLVRAAHFSFGGGRRGRLLVIVHHLAVDGVSWSLLLADLESCCLQLRRGVPVHLPEKTTSFKEWSERLERHSGTQQVMNELEYWCEELAGAQARIPLGGESDQGAVDARTSSIQMALSRRHPARGARSRSLVGRRGPARGGGTGDGPLGGRRLAGGRCRGTWSRAPRREPRPEPHGGLVHHDPSGGPAPGPVLDRPGVPQGHQGAASSCAEPGRRLRPAAPHASGRRGATADRRAAPARAAVQLHGSGRGAGRGCFGARPRWWHHRFSESDVEASAPPRAERLGRGRAARAALDLQCRPRSSRGCRGPEPDPRRIIRDVVSRRL